MGLLMTYRTYNKSTYEASIATLQEGVEDWEVLNETFGLESRAIEIDKSWKFLSILFEQSEVGNFFTGNQENTFEFEDVSFYCFSNEYLQLV